MDTTEEIAIIYIWIKQTYKTSYLIYKIGRDYIIMYVGKYSQRVDITVEPEFVWVSVPGAMLCLKWSNPELFNKMEKFINGSQI